MIIILQNFEDMEANINFKKFVNVTFRFISLFFQYLNINCTRNYSYLLLNKLSSHKSFCST